MAKNPIKPVLIDTYADPGLQYLNQKPEYFNVPSANVKTSNATPVYDQVTQVITNVINVSLPAGTNNEVQFNTNGTMSGDNEFKYDPNTDTLTVTNIKANTVSLGDVTSSKMQGGSNGDVLKTDGHGNLHFDAIFPSVSGQSGKVLKTDGITQVWGNVSYNDLTNTPSFATQSYVNNAIGDLINGAPSALNTLNELANALGNNASFASTITNALANKAEASALSNVAFTGSYNSLTNTPTIPSLTGLATETFVTSRGYINSSALSTTLTNYATTSYVGSQGFITSGTLTGYGYVTSDALSGYALTTDIPTDINQLADNDGLLNQTGLFEFVDNEMRAPVEDGLIIIPNNGEATGIHTTDGRGRIWFGTDKSLNLVVDDTYEHVFSPNGSVSFGGGYVFPNVNGATGQVLVADSTGVMTWQDQATSGSADRLVNGDFEVVLGNDGNLTAGNINVGNLALISVPDGAAITSNNSADIDMFTAAGGEGYTEIWLHHGANVEITTGTGTYSWNFTPTGNLVFPQITSSPAPTTSGIVFSDGTFQYTAAATDISGLTDNEGLLSQGNGPSFDQSLNSTDSVTFDYVTASSYRFPSGSVREESGDPSRLDIIVDAESNTYIRTNEGGYEWNFGNNGNLDIPNNLVGKSYLGITTNTTNDIDLYTNDWNGGGVEVYLQHDNRVSIVTQNGALEWSFTKEGEFKFPDYVQQRTQGTVMCAPNVDTIIYTGSNNMMTFKLLLKVEGTEITGQSWDTQSCEMMIAKGFRSDAVAGSVYGLVYTSQAPLATFTTRWNASTSLVEVLCRPTSTTENVAVRTFATEITTSD